MNKTAETIAQYGSRILTAQFFVSTDDRGNVDHANSYAQISLTDRAELRFPLIWSTSVTLKEAHAALELFEATGVTLIRP